MQDCLEYRHGTVNHRDAGPLTCWLWLDPKLIHVLLSFTNFRSGRIPPLPTGHVPIRQVARHCGLHLEAASENRQVAKLVKPITFLFNYDQGGNHPTTSTAGFSACLRPHHYEEQSLPNLDATQQGSEVTPYGLRNPSDTPCVFIARV